MKVEEYRNDIRDLLIRIDTRQEEMHHRIGRIEKHLEKLNGQTGKNSDAIIMFKTWGSAALFIVPIVVTLIMRLIP